MHSKRDPASDRFTLSPVAIAVVALAVLGLGGAHAQSLPEPLPVLRPTPMLNEVVPQQVRPQLPTFVSGERIQGRTDIETLVEGKAELRRGDTVIRADRLEYFQPNDLARARGNVYINRAGNIFEGPLLELKLETFEGFFNQPRYRFLANDAYGEAERVDFLDEKRSIIRNASYTTCRRYPGPSWMPDWILRAGSIALDTEEEVGFARNAVLSFKGVPILPVPALSFPLSDRRKSGVLPPTIGLDNVNGAEFTLPYYWNIAPNRDATLFPTLMTKRGADLAGEFRYLEPAYRGQFRGNYMPGDRLRRMDRWGVSMQHEGSVALPATGPVGLSLNINRVSDDNYWRDFSRTSAALTQRLLAADAHAAWGRGPFSFNARVLKWQVLQDPSAPIVPPYDRAPQLVARYSRADLPGGFEAHVEADHTRFESDRILNGQPNARRSLTFMQVSRPWQSPAAFVVPRMQLHATRYEFDAPLAGGARDADRVVPTFSVDSGLIFERDARFFGRNYRQTLEPRAFYVYTPFRDQRHLPNYDSAALDFNFATIYTENAFAGHDRIADNNLLTLGATTRLIDPDSGAEAARFGIAQRLRFKDQRVTLPGVTPVSERLSDLLFGASVNLYPQWTVDSTVQFNPKSDRSVRSTFGARYNPGSFRVVSATYRLQRGLSEQLDIGWQWPLNDLWGDREEARPGSGSGEVEPRWYSVGRLNLSLRDRRIVDTVIGLEYDAGCWIGRVVFDRLQSSTNTSNKRILFQLEFVGFTRLGSNALQALKQNIPRYQYLREHVSTPSRFSNYD